MWEKLSDYIDTSKEVSVYKWFEENHETLESHRMQNQRKFTYSGYANRAYRTPEDVIRSAAASGFKVNHVIYPMADKTEGPKTKTAWGKPNPRSVTWHADLEKC